MENSQNVSNTGTNNSSAIIRHELIGQIIADKYEVKRLLGRGGMGAVYEGKHLLLEKPVAIKVMSTELAEDATALSRFMREAKTAAKLEHNNAVTIHDFGVWQENIAYIVMEFISGVSLRDMLEQNKTITPLETVKWMSQICSAVGAAHSCGIIHRDLKPENIMLKQSGDGEPIIKVVDFGLAKIIKDEEGSGANITKTGEVFGTPYYMGPEFYDGDSVDHQADIYALGVIAYEMLSGRPPFYGTIEKIIAAHLFQEPRSLVEYNPSLEPFDSVIRLALKKKRSERLSSAIEFSNLLKTVLIENPSLAPSGLEGLSISGLSKSAQELTPTIKQPTGAITLIPNTTKFDADGAKQTSETEASKTQMHPVGTAKVSITSPISANTLAALQLPNQMTMETSPAAIENQTLPSNTKRLPLAIGAIAGVVLAVGGLFYNLRDSTPTPSPATNSSTPAPTVINNASPTPTIKFSDPESPTNTTNATSSNDPSEDTTSTTPEAKKTTTPKSKVTVKSSTSEDKNTVKINNQNDKNIIVKGVKAFGGLFGGKDKKDKDKKDKNRKDRDD